MRIHMLFSRVRKFYPCVFLLLTGLALSSCITTTTGGFVIEASEEQALDDYMQLAIAYYDANDMQGARRHITNAMNISDRDSSVYTVLALIYQREGDLQLAGENFQRAINLDRGNSRARNNYAVLLFELERYRDVYQQLERVANDVEYEGRAIAFENLGRAAIQLNRLSDAQIAFERALQLNPNLYVSALESALVYFEMADYERARSKFQNYLTISEYTGVPHSPRALLAGIQIEDYFQNQRFVDNVVLVLETLYRTSPEYQTYLSMQNGR
jgi:type IV pilus assembly protein PilF